MIKSASSLNARLAFPFQRYILAIGIRLTIFVFIVAVHFICEKNEKMALYINATITDAHPF
jgi:hypothetical protein